MSRYLLVLMALTITTVASLRSKAEINVAFIEILDSQGRPLLLEPGGQFAHIAISYRGGWLHSHPYRGVEVIGIGELEKIGRMKAVIQVSRDGELDASRVRDYLGKAYDPYYSWTDERIYCSELVAKLLKISPQPMNFDPKLWPSAYAELNGMLGLSPDDIFKVLSSSKSASVRSFEMCEFLAK